MSQSVQLSVSGLYTAPSDYAGLPPGALDVAMNVESRHKNILESRRGFEAVTGTESLSSHILRITNFPVTATDAQIILTSTGYLNYHHNGDLTQTALPGYTSGLVEINRLAKNRFLRGNQNLYITDQSGVLSFSSGSGSKVLPAGVPRGLDLTATATSDSSGFFTNNTVLSTTAHTTSASPTLSALGSSSGVTEDMYIAGTGIPAGTQVLSINDEAEKLITTGDITGGSTAILNVAVVTGLVAGDLVSGIGIQDGSKITSVVGSTVNISLAAIRTQVGVTLTFSSPLTITMTQNATATATVSVTFYSGSQVAYRALFGRVETDQNGNTTTRYGAPSAMAIATNTSGTSTNATIVVTIPKNSSDRITFIQLYRSQASASVDIEPLDQMQLVYEANLVAGDFTARQVSITDHTEDSNKGIPLYTGTDREGILQANLAPPASWDMAIYRNFAIFANTTQPSTLEATLTAVGAPSGLQSGDTITITYGTQTETYTAAATEAAASRQFKVFSSGTASQNITDTANSLIRVINYDNALSVHAILTSTATDLPGQITFEADIPYGTFTVTASAHATAWDPTLTALVSDVNNYNNGVFVSKVDELESVPGANLYRVGDSSADILRVIALRDYAVVLKTDGVYKILGTDPKNLSVIPFDLTTNLIGPDTAVSLNSGVWMLSNQGVVSIDDSGVNAKSPPIDNQFNELVGTNLDSVNEVAFALGYESDRKYILAMPEDVGATFNTIEYNYNYVTNAWTNWDRNVYAGFIHSSEGKVYIARADDTHNGISKERRSGTYLDAADESDSTTITSVTSGTVVVVADASNIVAGDVLYQSTAVLSPVTAVNITTNTVTLQYTATWATGAVTIVKAITCRITFKQVFGDNPAFVRQFPDGLVLFKETGFNNALLNFATDYSQSTDTVTLESSLLGGLWGLFPWGSAPWDGGPAPSSIRFYVPQNKQLGSYIIPTLTIRQAWSAWKFQGMSMSWNAVSSEVGN